jgi:anti-anti-sigma factor
LSRNHDKFKGAFDSEGWQFGRLRPRVDRITVFAYALSKLDDGVSLARLAEEVTSPHSPLEGFAVVADFIEGRSVLSLRGDLDRLSAPELGAILSAVIDRGHKSVVLDLAELDLMDAAGLAVITEGAGRLRLLGGKLSIRSPSSMVRRILISTGLYDLVPPEPAGPATGHLGPEQPAGPYGLPTNKGPDGPAAQLKRAASSPSEDDVIDGTLRLVVALARATVGGADGASVSLRRHGQLTTVAASDQTVLDMDTDQYTAGEGPCVDASVEGRWFHAESLDAEIRWPRFTPRARALGINAILSAPLMAQDRPVGALNIYSRTASAFAPKDQKLASVFAVEASIILSDTWARGSDSQHSVRYQEALRTRQTIALAQGVVMERLGVSQDDAYTVLRSFAQQTSQPLHRRAQEVVASARRAGSDPQTGPRPGRHD